VISYCEETLYEKAGMYSSFLAEYLGSETVLNSLPDSLKKEIEKNAKTPDEKIFALSEMIRLNKYSPEFEGKDEFLKADREAEYSMGRSLLKEGKYTDAFSHFRKIFREYTKSAEAEGIKAQIAEKIDSARNSKDFNSIYNLASFLVGEMKGMSIPGDLGRKLADCLRDTADFYKDISPMKRAFMLSLMSDVLGNTPEGKKAGEEAIKIGFEAVSKLPFREQEKAALELPSLVKGCSVDAVRNSTPYHLMAFYSGPERFFVRMNPYSRGSVAMMNGEYEIAAVVTSDDIIPYRTKYKYENEILLHNYYISEGGKDEKQDDYSDDFMGKFTILHLPKGLENVIIEPDSGVIIPNPAIEK
jgi:tetratricopeptide (TPR) repeat protein